MSFIKVLFYGPSLLPLILPGNSLSGVLPGVVVNIKQYGLTFGNAKPQSGTSVSWLKAIYGIQNAPLRYIDIFFKLVNGMTNNEQKSWRTSTRYIYCVYPP